MREILVPVAPEALRPAFRQVLRVLQRQTALDPYRYLGGYLLRSAALGNCRQLQSNVANAVADNSVMDWYSIAVNYWPRSLYTQN